MTALAETKSQPVVVRRTHLHIWVGGVGRWELDGYEKLFSPICTSVFTTGECTIELLICFLLPCVIDRSAFWEFYSRGYVPLLVSV